MVIGLGDEKDLSLNSLQVVGRIAAREAVRLKAKARCLGAGHPR